MSLDSSRSIVVLGTMTKMPVPGVIWQTVHYLEGLRRLGYDVTYVEAHARTPSMFAKGTPDYGTSEAARFITGVLSAFGFGSRWAYHALHHDGSCHGMSEAALLDAYASAEVLLNLCGGTQPRPEHVDTGRLVLVCTDPVQIEVELWKGRAKTREFLDAHCAVVTFGENYGKPGCEVPVSPGYRPIPTRQPVVLDLWEHDLPDSGRYTTVANWHQSFRPLRYRGELYHWSKDREFRKFLDLPARTGSDFELALASCREEDRSLLEEHGWTVRQAAAFGLGAHRYRSYVQRSRAEFTVAKDQNVRLRSGWFSDRSATYLAAGRPVITQDTGFETALPTGDGLFAVRDVDAAVEAVAIIEADYRAASAGARSVARACFDHRVVLPRMLSDLGVEGPARRFPLRSAGRHPAPDPPTRRASVAPEDLVLTPISRRPLRLPADTVRSILSRPLPRPTLDGTHADAARTVSVIVVTFGNLHLTRLCLESLLAHTWHPAYEVIVVDNASANRTPDYLRSLASLHPCIRLILNPLNVGFGAACNQGARVARGDLLVFLNNDVVLAPGWLAGLVEPLSDPKVGALNPVTNRIGTPAEVGVDGNGTYGGFLRSAAERRREYGAVLRDVRMLALFCLAVRRETWEQIGELDEGFGAGLFEDDDYSRRLAGAGLRLACVESVLVHHFGEASFGDLVPDGTYARLFERNRRRFQEKWGTEWTPLGRAPDEEYDELVRRVREEVEKRVPPGAIVAVVSRGDGRLTRLGRVRAWHFPNEDGGWAGYYPADDAEAVRKLEAVRQGGAEYLLIPRPGFWWLEHYDALRSHLDRHARVVTRSGDLTLYRLRERTSVGTTVDDDGDGRAHIEVGAQ